MIQRCRCCAKLLTSLQAVSTQPRAILRMLLVRNQTLVIFASSEHPHCEILLTLSLPSILSHSPSLTLNSVCPRLHMCALDFMHKLICMSIFVFVCVCVCVVTADKLIEDLGIKPPSCAALSHIGSHLLTWKTHTNTHAHTHVRAHTHTHTQTHTTIKVQSLRWVIWFSGFWILWKLCPFCQCCGQFVCVCVCLHVRVCLSVCVRVKPTKLANKIYPDQSDSWRVASNWTKGGGEKGSGWLYRFTLKHTHPRVCLCNRRLGQQV